MKIIGYSHHKVKSNKISSLAFCNICPQDDTVFFFFFKTVKILGSMQKPEKDVWLLTKISPTHTLDSAMITKTCINGWTLKRTEAKKQSYNNGVCRAIQPNCCGLCGSSMCHNFSKERDEYFWNRFTLSRMTFLIAKSRPGIRDCTSVISCLIE